MLPSLAGLALLVAPAAPAASPAVEGPAPPPAKSAEAPPPRPEGPALPPSATGARNTTSRAWLKESPAQQGDPSGVGSLGLTRTRTGSYLYVDPGKRFTVAINPDGSVRFGDRWGRDQHGKRVPGSGWALRQIGPSGVGMGGPTEWLRALSQQELDPGAKTEFLNLTREVRTQLAVAFMRNVLRVRLGELEGELLAISNDADTTLAERRALLFARWDECDERFDPGRPGGEVPEEALSEIDRDRLTAASTARRTIEAFIRRQHPRGSKRGYSAAELADFNRRRVSAEEFAPYTPKEGP